MGKRLTNEEFLKRVHDHYGNRFTFLDDYVNGTVLLRCRCNVCNDIFPASPQSFMRGIGGCRNCYGKKKMSTEDFQNRLNKVWGSNRFKVIGTYEGAHKKIAVECLKCGYGKDKGWKVDPQNILHGHGCPNCYGNAPLNQSDVEAVIDSEGCGQYRLVKMYKPKSDQTIVVEHLVCNHSYPVTLAHFREGYRCPFCASPKGEKRILIILCNCLHLTLGRDFYTQWTFSDLKYKKKLRFDFYFPNKNLVIEYDGKQHFEPVDFANKGSADAIRQFKLNKKRDLLKNTYCKKHDITLIRLDYKKYERYKDLKSAIIKLFTNTSKPLCL